MSVHLWYVLCESYFCQFLQSGYFHTPSLIVTQMQMQYIHFIE